MKSFCEVDRRKANMVLIVISIFLCISSFNMYTDSIFPYLVTTIFSLLFIVGPIWSLIVARCKGKNLLLQMPVLTWLVLHCGLFGLIYAYFVIRLIASIFNLLLGPTIDGYLIPLMFLLPIIIWCRLHGPIWKEVLGIGCL